MLGITCLLDRLMYGSWILVPLNFLKFNVLSSGGDFYGTHKWHWYFTQGFSAMLFSFIPFSISGIITSRKWKLSGLIIWVLGIHSLLGHKEFRYLFLFHTIENTLSKSIWHWFEVCVCLFYFVTGLSYPFFQ